MHSPLRDVAIWCLLWLTPLLPAEDLYRPSASGAAQLVVAKGIAMARVQGSGEEMGGQIADLAGAPLRFLLQSVVRQVDEAALAQIPPAYLPELTAIASGIGVEPRLLATANLVVDRRCSVLVYRDRGNGTNSQPLLLARNMDYAPAEILGPTTLLTIYRGRNCHAFASVGWPGYCGVVSGMNDAGVCVCILLNEQGVVHRSGEPICFRLREMLEQATTVEGAARLFAASPVASSHYVVVADSLTACVLWQDRDGVRRQGLILDRLTCTNAARAADGVQSDVRGTYLTKLISACPHPDAAWMRSALTGCYVSGLNAQAMVFIPERRQLQLALSEHGLPAALCDWQGIDLGGLMAGQAFPTPLTTELGLVPVPLTHYTSP